ncbi:efflux RND transporter periplasmic adaptor subunit, partial [Caulobacter sp.]|uniref:HlyD family secretion protein n=1 Tax=Caulobacter sp. TaxID=78 RepID=UPI001B1AA1B2
RSAALAALDLATTTATRHRELAAQGWVSRARLDEAEAGRTRASADAKASSAAIDAQRQRIEVLGAQSEAAAAALAQAEAVRELARIDLDNTVVRAPVAGVVGDRQVRVGRLVAPGVRLLDIVSVAGVYVVANFKETQLARIRPGQRAVVRVDGYPDRMFEGVVDSFAPGSGAACGPGGDHRRRHRRPHRAPPSARSRDRCLPL